MVETYENIKKLIENTEYLLELHKDELRVWRKLLSDQSKPPKGLPACSYSEFVQGGSNDTSLDRIVDNIRQYEHMIYLEENSLQSMERQLESIKKTLGQLQGLEYKIAHMKLIEGLTQQEIKIELDKQGLEYSLSYIKKICAKVKAPD